MWSLAVALGAWSVWLWPDVPARVPAHFGPDGAPDRWVDRSLGAWFALPLVGLVVAAAVDALVGWARRHPASPVLNLPNKAAILALPPPHRAVVMDRVAAMIYATVAPCLAGLALIQVGVWTAARGGDGAPWVLAGGLAAIALPLGGLVWGVVRVDAELKRQQETSGASPQGLSPLTPRPPSS